MYSTDLAALAGRIASLERLVTQLNRSSRLGQSSIEGGAIQVYDTDGTHRASLGVQEDGTVGLTAVNGPTPPTPSLPQLSSVLGGVAAAWDGTFADGDSAPLDWTFTEVHASPTAGDFTPDASTLRGTIATVCGGTLVIPADAPVWVRLAARTTSGVASDPSDPAGPVGPAPVVAQEVLDGIVTELALADDAVTAAKIAAGAVDADALAQGAVTATAIGQSAVTATALADGSVATGALAASAVTAGKISAGAVTAAALAAGAVTAGTIAAGAVTTVAMTAGSINGDRIAAGSIAAAQIAAASITGAQIKALSITSDQLAVNTVTADKLAAGSVSADKLTVGTGGANIVPDYSFEGAYAAALLALPANTAYWSLDVIGNGSAKSAKSAKLNSASPAAATRSLQLATVPVIAADQFYLQFDYQASATWAGAAVKFYLRWLDSTGATLGYGFASTSTPVLGPA